MKSPIEDPYVKKREPWLKNFVLGLTANPPRLTMCKDKPVMGTWTELWKKMLKKTHILTTTAEIGKPYSFIFIVPMILNV